MALAYYVHVLLRPVLSAHSKPGPVLGTLYKSSHSKSPSQSRLSFFLLIITGWTLLIFNLSMFYRLIFSFILQPVFPFPSYSLLFLHEKLTFPVVIFGFLSLVERKLTTL